MDMNKTIGRDAEKEIILNAIERGNNLCISGPIYRGKTHLVNQIAEELTQRKYIPIYFNCMTGFNEKSFLEAFSKSILKNMSFKLKNIFEDSQKYLPNIRPKINMNPIHGVDIRIDYNVTNKDISQYLSEMINVPNKIYEDTKEKIVIIFDEYQSVQELAGVNITDIIARSIKVGVSYIFVSSKAKELDKIIPKKNYDKMLIADNLQLAKIPLNVLYFYVDNAFKDAGIKVTNNIIDKLISITDSEIAFFNIILQKLIYKGKIFKRVSLMDISSAIKDIVNGYDDIFFNFFDSLSTHQKNFIIAIAREGGKQIFKGEFIYHNGLVSVPSVQTSINALIKKNFVHKENSEYIITNFFFKEWLKRNFL